jgi:hypothetical protein
MQDLRFEFVLATYILISFENLELDRLHHVGKKWHLLKNQLRIRRAWRWLCVFAWYRCRLDVRAGREPAADRWTQGPLADRWKSDDINPTLTPRITNTPARTGLQANVLFYEPDWEAAAGFIVYWLCCPELQILGQLRYEICCERGWFCGKHVEAGRMSVLVWSLRLRGWARMKMTQKSCCADGKQERRSIVTLPF